MDLSVLIHNEPVTVWQPDALTLQEMQFEPAPHDNPAWLGKHPTKPNVTVSISRSSVDGKMHLFEYEGVQKQYGGATSTSLCVFIGWCYSKADFDQLLNLIRWTIPKNK
jgi:hypothetical protein